MSKTKRTGPDWQTVGLGTLAGVVAGMGLIVMAVETEPTPIVVEIIDGATETNVEEPGRFELSRQFVDPESEGP